jgi:hypothetical protein
MRVFYLFPLLVITSAFAKPCGLQGPIEERIKDCAQVKGAFALIAVSEKGAEIYRDMKSKLIWGNRVATDFNQYGSQKACSIEVSEYQTLNTLKWRLPSIREFEEAAAHGMKSALPNMEHSYWSSTPVLSRKTKRRRARAVGVYVWDGFEEKSDVGDNLKDAASVRCVAREQD